MKRCFLLLGVAGVLFGGTPARADFLAGVVAFESRDYTVAWQELSAPDTVGVPDAAYYLGRMALLGLGRPADRAAGVTLLSQAADKGSLEAALFLAQAYEFGLGLARDRDAALPLYKTAAALGSSVAQVRLGYFASHGIGGPVDSAAALAWYEMAAESGDPAALTSLGYLYENGLGVAADAGLAEQLYRAALLKNYPLAANNLAFLLATQGRDLAEAEALVRDALAHPNASPVFADTLGFVLMQKGDLVGAEQVLLDAAKRAPRYSDVRERLGDLYWAQGRRLEAQGAWQEALQLTSDEAARQRLESKLAGEVPL